MSTLPSTQRMPSGPAIAAFMSAALGLFTMALANLTQEAVAGFDQTLLAIGSWIPNYKGIGPYSGKETIMVVVWLGTWAIMNFAFRKKDFAVRAWTILFIVLIGVSALLFWPPFWHILLGK
ncbi:MAG: hypothetical protein HY070_12015 [Chloroflexi bacterium]|nr:hypothetical protein [Chloroflexota bacterium]